MKRPREDSGDEYQQQQQKKKVKTERKRKSTTPLLYQPAKKMKLDDTKDEVRYRRDILLYL